MNKAYILLGSNLGNKLAHLQKAIALMELNNISLILGSNLYQTAAWGNINQDDFYNQVIKVKTPFAAEQLLQTLLQIEIEMGRVRSQKWEARIIDLDVLYFNNEIIATENLKVPHPLLHMRRFTLAPLTEIAPEFKHPFFNKTNQELLAICEDISEVNVVINP
jgi:2-amino-4-hydroxy-6-hydroxymethyldihydropteridine diphosphokinase